MNRSIRTSLTSLSLVTLVAACDTTERPTLPPPGHHVVTIDTDAIVPPDPMKSLDPLAPIPLFDRLELAVLRGTDATPRPDEVRDFPVNAATFAPRGASFTVEGAPGEVVRVRARLFRDASSFAGVPRPETTIEVVAELPPTPAEGGLPSTVFLRTEDVGVPRGSAMQPLDPSDSEGSIVRPGAPEASEVGSWPGARPIPCAAAPQKGEACVQGGAYWMGNPLVKGDDFVESDRQRLVVLSPYFLETREVRVGELRAWLSTQPTALDTVSRRSTEKSSPNFFCTYTDTPEAENETRPANCVPWDLADAYCKAKGGALPSEAQFEYASSELRSALFVWGADEAPLCEAAVWGRSGLLGSAIETIGERECLDKLSGSASDPTSAALLIAGAQPLPEEDLAALAKTRLTDRITIGGVEVFDLAGNLQEWVQDRYNKQEESCWSVASTNLFVDPVCTTPGTIAGRSVRGGSWIQSREFLRAAYRANRAEDDNGAYVIGFRCARPAG